MKVGRVPVWQLYLTLGALAMVLYGWVGPFEDSGLIQPLIGFVTVAGILFAQHVYKPTCRLPWILFAAGFFLFACADIYTYVLPRMFAVEVPFPSWGDLMYVLVYPVQMAGLIILVRRRNPGTDRSGVVDSLIITLGLSLLVWIFAIAPNLHDGELTLLQKIVSVAYPAGDILLLAAIVRLSVGGGSRQPAFYFLASSVAVLLITDTAYTILTFQEIFSFQLWLDFGWMSYYLLWGAAALHPSMRTLDEPSYDLAPRLTRPRLLALTVASLVAPTLLMTNEVGNNDFDMMVVVATSVILVGLVVARMSGLVHQQERTADRERVLTAAGADLVRATDRAEIHTAALDAVQLFCGTSAAAFICQPDTDRITVLATAGCASAGDLPRPLAPATSAALFAALKSDSARITIDQQLGADLGAEPEHHHAVAIEPSVAHGDAEFFVVTSSEPIAAVVRGSLRALATQMALALESATLTEQVHRRTSEARFGSLIRHSSDLITVLDAEAKVIYQSPSIETLLGYKPEEIVGTRFDRLLPIGERGRLAHLLADDVVTGSGETQVIECGLDHVDGTTLQFEILHTNLLADEHVQGIVLNCRDVSERKAFEEQLAHQAFHDPVTNLANRALFSERVRHAVSRTRRGQAALAVIFVDLDDFKTVNDSLGHTAGDEVLLQVAHRMSLSIRASDTAARFGGDEFAILLEDLEGPQEAADAADRMLEAFTEPLTVDGKEIYIRASIGIAVMEAGRVTDAQELIRDADVAMYMAKRDGKGTYRLFEPEMHAGVLDRLELRGDLQRALGADQFELEYQPIVRLADGSITGVEALVRWRHPERGLLSPDWFIPLAEETGLIVPIGSWVLEQACTEAKRLQQVHGGERPLTMSVNLSLKQLQHNDVVEHVSAALRASGLDPRHLTLEITESLMMADPDLGVQRLADLRSLGVTLAMDDFGTGYSSLSYLSRFPVDELKMDRSFLREGATPKTSRLTAAVLALGQSLNLTVVAEGIEHHEQWMTLRDLGCELGQGFYFARPMSAESLIGFLRMHKEGTADFEQAPAGKHAT